jgi:hypothetical protein
MNELTGGLRGSLEAAASLGPSPTYIRKLHNALDKRRPYTTYNRDISHARVVVIAGIEHAEEEIKILSHNLDLDVYGGIAVVETMHQFLGGKDSTTRLDVLVEDDVAEVHPMLDLINRKKNATIKKVPEDWTEKYQCNFMIVDDIGYRYESNRNSLNATVVFHDEEKLSILEQLREIFDILSEQAVDVTTW